MTQGIEAVTNAALSMALDAAALRQQLFATNIANANTDGYAPQRLDFEGHVQDARRRLAERGQLDGVTVAALAAEPAPVVPLLAANGAPAAVQLDMEVAGMSQNAVQYQALLRGLSRQLGILSLAVGDGKR